jgi:hypothetical protein
VNAARPIIDRLRALRTSHLLVSIDEDVIEALDPNEAKAGIFHVGDDIERLTGSTIILVGLRSQPKQPLSCRGVIRQERGGSQGLQPATIAGTNTVFAPDAEIGASGATGSKWS